MIARRRSSVSASSPPHFAQRLLGLALDPEAPLAGLAALRRRRCRYRRCTRSSPRLACGCDRACCSPWRASVCSATSFALRGGCSNAVRGAGEAPAASRATHLNGALHSVGSQSARRAPCRKVRCPAGPSSYVVKTGLDVIGEHRAIDDIGKVTLEAARALSPALFPHLVCARGRLAQVGTRVPE